MKFYIKIAGKKSYKKVMKKLEKQGYKWIEKTKDGYAEVQPTKFSPNPFGVTGKIGILVNTESNEKILSWGKYNVEISGYTTITAEEFLAEGKETIVIYRKGNETIALDKSTGRKAVAKCSQEDTYDFYTGAELALIRLTDMTDDDKPFKPQHPMCRCSIDYGIQVNGYLKSKNHADVLYGRIGENTLLKDRNGRILKIGDVVRVYDNTGKNRGITVITRDFYEDFAMGFKSVFGKNGEVADGYEIEFVWDCNSMKNGDVVHDIEYTIKEEQPEQKKPQYYNGKVVCVNNIGNPTDYTIGRIYEFTDGQITTDNGRKFPSSSEIYSFKDWQKWSGSKFIELVE